jgi:hypothetical protein
MRWSMRSLLYVPGLLMLFCLTSCEGIKVRVGPEETERQVYVKPGQPATVCKNVKVPIENTAAGAKKTATQDIGGWKVMPPEHFDALMNRLKELEQREKDAAPEK